MNELYATYQSLAKGGSGRGQSFYKLASECGRKAHLVAEESANGERSDDQAHFDIGTAYHLFHQAAATTDLVPALDMRDERIDPSFVEGNRLFLGWRQLWGSMGAKYGRVIGAELEASTELAGQPYTGKLDAVVEIADIEAFRLKTGLQLPEPGIYIVDHKSAKGASDSHAFEFTQGLQGAGYLHMYPEAHGIIFDVLYKVKTFRHEPEYSKDGKKLMAGKSYAHFLQTRQPDDVPRLEALVRYGARNFADAAPNPRECLGNRKPCPFFASGKCSGW